MLCDRDESATASAYLGALFVVVLPNMNTMVKLLEAFLPGVFIITVLWLDEVKLAWRWVKEGKVILIQTLVQIFPARQKDGVSFNQSIRKARNVQQY